MADKGSDHGTAVASARPPSRRPAPRWCRPTRSRTPASRPTARASPTSTRSRSARTSAASRGCSCCRSSAASSPSSPTSPSRSCRATSRRCRLNNLLLGLGIALALFGIGFGAVHWSKSLMDGHDLVETRHPTRGSEETREKAVEVFHLGNKESGFTRRKLIRNTLIGALVVSPLPAVVLFRDLAPAGDPVDRLKHTLWDEGRPPHPRSGRHADQGVGRHARARSSTSSPRA